MPANVTYASISLSTVLGKESSGGVWKTVTTPITLNDDTKTYRCSLSSTSNALNVDFTTDHALSCWQIWITKATDEYGPNKGNRAYSETNIEAGGSRSISVLLTGYLFNYREGTYRIGLYAKSQEDDCWDVTELFMVYDVDSSDHVSFVPSDSDGYEVFDASIERTGHTGGGSK